MSAKVLVTGVNGLIGHALVRRLRGLGGSVIATDQTLPGDLDVPMVCADLRDRAGIAAMVAEHRPQAIVHSGGISGPMVAPGEPTFVFDVNVGGTISVCDAAKRQGVGRLIFLSSIVAYGDQPDEAPVTEATPLLGSEPYAASKVAGEGIVRAYAREGLDATSLRLGAVYGPRRTTSCVVRVMLENALAGRPTRIEFSGSTRRQYVYVEDVVDAIMLALDKPRPKLPAYNVTAGIRPTIAEVSEAARQTFPSLDVSFEGAVHPFDNRIGTLQIEAAERDLGYRPKTSLVDGMRAYADWLRRRAAA